MRELTPAGRMCIDDAARRHSIDADAVAVLLQAIDRGGGRQAQFSHPAFGGMGQWTRDGLMMIGDMFNHGLKARVDALCRDLAAAHDDRALFVPTAKGGSGHWWPDDLGTPSSSGAQNEMGYACFPDRRRLAIRQDGIVRLYDTGDHRLMGVSQQQGSGQDLAFTSQHGAVRLRDLALVDANEASGHVGDPLAQTDDEASAADAGHGSSAAAFDVFGKIERLHDLHRKGILTDVEYAETKKDLLARL